MIRRIICFAICVVISDCELYAQESEPSHVERLDAAVRRVVAYLESLPGYSVQVTQPWKLEGTTAAVGCNKFSLDAQHGGEFRLQVSSDAESRTSLDCTSDGRRIVRVIRSEHQVLYSMHDGGLQQLLQDAMTESSLRYSGLDLLCRSDPERYVMVMASHVQYLGRQDLPSGPADHFRMTWGAGDAHHCELWISADEAPLLLRMKTTVKLLSHQHLEQQLHVTADLEWKRVEHFPDEHFRQQVPENAVEVADLHSLLHEGDTSALVGKPAPSVNLKLLDGTKWTLPREQSVVVLYFFASWIVPSHHQKQALLEMFEDDKFEGAAFNAISVGEDAETVRTFVRAKRYQHSIVLDPKREAAAAYGVTALPTIVLIGKEGTVQSVYVGNTPETRVEIEREVTRLLDADVERSSS
jgi:peroxiredoxin